MYSTIRFYFQGSRAPVWWHEILYPDGSWKSDIFTSFRPDHRAAIICVLVKHVAMESR